MRVHVKGPIVIKRRPKWAPPCQTAFTVSGPENISPIYCTCGFIRAGYHFSTANFEEIAHHVHHVHKLRSTVYQNQRWVAYAWILTRHVVTYIQSFLDSIYTSIMHREPSRTLGLYLLTTCIQAEPRKVERTSTSAHLVRQQANLLGYGQPS